MNPRNEGAIVVNDVYSGITNQQQQRQEQHTHTPHPRLMMIASARSSGGTILMW